MNALIRSLVIAGMLMSGAQGLSALELGQSDDRMVKISPQLAAALERGVEHLARTQNTDGSWSSDDYGKNVGQTSLCLMALMAMGNLPGEGPYGANVALGVNWILEQGKPNGLIQFTDQGKQAPAMYGHALATLMLSEVWGQTRHRQGPKDVGNVLRKAADLIVQVQGPKGGWGYESIPKDGDTSVVVMQIFALKSAQEAGIHVPQSTIDKAIELVKTRYNEKERIYGYSNTQRSDGHIGSSAAGTCIMFITGQTDPRYTAEPLDEILDIAEEMSAGKRYNHAFYFSYYTAVASYTDGEKSFGRAMKALEPFLLSKQDRHGGWGKPFQTAFAILAGALPYRYLPIYQR